MSNLATNIIRKYLGSILPDELADKMVSYLISSIGEYQTKRYDAVVLSSGKFVELAIRGLEFLMDGKYTPLSKRVPNFTDQLLNDFAEKNNCEPYKTLIPRVLFSMYCIRNKRGGIHISISEPNRLDAAKLIYDMRWVIFEFISDSPNIGDDEMIGILEKISSPLLQIVWDVDGTKRVLSERATCSEQILLLLCSCDGMSVERLLMAIEYKNATRFKNIVSELHRQRLINCRDNRCTISPLGVKEVEKIMDRLSEENV